jgi:hypothetical protein
MAAKKETKEKKIVKPVVTTKKVKKPKIVEGPTMDIAEQQFFANDLAEKMGIASFDFLLIKREAGIEDGSPITRSEMQELYDKIIKGR